MRFLMDPHEEMNREKRAQYSEPEKISSSDAAARGGLPAVRTSETAGRMTAAAVTVPTSAPE
jgi:hypothetical protein